MSGPRTDLATRLDAAAAANVTVFAEEPISAPALPALIVRPGSPYRESGNAPCDEVWGLEVLALVAIDTLTPMDDLDALVTVTRDVIRAWPYARYNGVRSSPQVMSMAGKSMRAAIVDLDYELLEA
jgi:hypothetical protein